MATLPSKPPETGKHMTKIWKETGFVDGDIWVTETEERKAGEGEQALLPLEAFLEAVHRLGAEAVAPGHGDDVLVALVGGIFAHHLRHAS